jgi:trehalose synthase-fused probable maltokinase
VPLSHTLSESVGRLDGPALAGFRWYAGKGAEVADVRLLASLQPDPAGASLAIVQVADAGGSREIYALPARVGARGELEEPPADDPLWRTLAALVLRGGTLEGAGCRIDAVAGPADVVADPGGSLRSLGADQSNTTLVLDERVALKCYRRLAWGAHPEIELTRRLTRDGVASVPAVHGTATLCVDDLGEAGLLLAQDYIAGAVDGWALAEGELERLLEDGDVDEAALAPGAWAPGAGDAVAALHAALAADGTLASPLETARWRLAAERLIEQALAMLPPEAASALREAAPGLRAALAGLDAAPPPLVCRVHGDLHLGQLLLRDSRVWIVDFEGEPAGALTERRAPHTPLRDLATLLRSVDHAAHWVRGRRAAEGRRADPAVAAAWIDSARGELREAYDAGLRARNAPIAIDERIIRALEAEKAVDELLYAVRFLPTWLDVPVAALRTFA